MDIVRRLSGSEDGVQYLAKYAAIVLPPLSRLLTAKKVHQINICPNLTSACNM